MYTLIPLHCTVGQSQTPGVKHSREFNEAKNFQAGVGHRDQHLAETRAWYIELGSLTWLVQKQREINSLPCCGQDFQRSGYNVA